MKLKYSPHKLGLLTRLAIPQNVIISLVTTLFLSVVSSGCSLLEISQQTKDVNQAGTISGSVAVESGSDAPVTILLFTKQDFAPQLERKYSLQGAGEFRFYAREGSYYVAAFQDTNRDNLYQQIEPATIFGGDDIFNATALTLDSNGHIELGKLLLKDPISKNVNRDNIK
ncbi:MAG: hypothetical protein ABW158_13520 [Candidatus Thiodiazotropha sp. 6PDIVS]